MRWAGFSTKDIEKYLKDHKGEGLPPDEILLANSVAASDDHERRRLQAQVQ